jgi:hypothetical protein
MKIMKDISKLKYTINLMLFRIALKKKNTHD